MLIGKTVAGSGLAAVVGLIRIGLSSCFSPNEFYSFPAANDGLEELQQESLDYFSKTSFRSSKPRGTSTRTYESYSAQFTKFFTVDSVRVGGNV